MRGLLGSGPGGSATCAKAPRPEAVSAPHSVPQGSTQSPRREGLESKLDQSLGQHFGVNMDIKRETEFDLAIRRGTIQIIK